MASQLDTGQDGNTLGEAINMRFTVTAVCSPCNHHQILDLESLQETFGPDMRLRRVALRLRCSKCGRRDCGIIVQPVTRPN
ncbi:hypothetical protein [Oricola indica]|uniref:hypothetical protein n=1 Tax=Oricola indica TaxID=2872591 RepID=UPI001CC17A25|nr:hypothetical protein [Oricola indica]